MIQVWEGDGVERSAHDDEKMWIIERTDGQYFEYFNAKNQAVWCGLPSEAMRSERYNAERLSTSLNRDGFSTRARYLVVRR